MSRETLVCGTCDGYGKLMSGPGGVMENCPDCGGTGRVPCTVARDELALAAAEQFGGKMVDGFLEFLDVHRDLTVPWLWEAGIVRDTILGLEHVPAVRPDLGSYHKDYVAPRAQVVDYVVAVQDEKRRA